MAEHRIATAVVILAAAATAGIVVATSSGPATYDPATVGYQVYIDEENNSQFQIQLNDGSNSCRLASNGSLNDRGTDFNCSLLVGVLGSFGPNVDNAVDTYAVSVGTDGCFTATLTTNNGSSVTHTAPPSSLSGCGVPNT